MPSLPPRDLTGSGNHPPQARWPRNAKVALNFTIVYDEGAEYNGLDDGAVAESKGASRDLAEESAVEFGSRCGFWRWHRLFTAKKVPVTVSVAGLALSRNVAAAGALKEAVAEREWEVASCGWRKYGGYPYDDSNDDEEQEHLLKTIKLHQDLLGKRPFGFSTNGHPTLKTRSLVIREGGFLYDADSTADELPYWIMPKVGGEGTTMVEAEEPVGGALAGRPHLILPYSPTECDITYIQEQNHDAIQFTKHLTDTLRFFYDEARANSRAGNQCKMMTVTLHSRMARPAVVHAISEFLDAAKGYGPNYVWICTREQIANHWYEHHLPRGVGSPIKPHQISEMLGGSAMGAMGLGSGNNNGTGGSTSNGGSGGTPSNTPSTSNDGNNNTDRFSFLPNLTKAREPEPELSDDDLDNDKMKDNSEDDAAAAAASDDEGDII